MDERFNQILDEKVRPALALHGGDIEVLEVAGGVLRFRFLGHCSSCPSAMLTTRQLVEEEVCSALPEIRSVELVEQVSESLLDQARALLNHV